MPTEDICKGLTFNECELVILRQSVDNAKFKTNQEELKSPEIKRIFDILEEFIKRKKLILYGGTAINNILPKKDQFYDKRYVFPDYDMYSYNAIGDSKELVDLYIFHGFRECEAKSAIHEGTYKVYVNFIPIADITQVQKSLFNSIKKDAIVIDGILHSPPNLLRMSMYLELSRPFGDVSRWEKVLKRLILLNKHYPLKAKNCKNIDLQRNIKIKKNEGVKIYDLIKKIFIDEQVVFFGSYALSKYSKYMSHKMNGGFDDKPDFDVLCENPEKVCEKIKKVFEDNDIYNCSIIKHKKIGEIIPEHYEVKIGKNTNIQDLSCIHTDTNTKTIIGDNVTIGHKVMLHGCKIEDNCLIGMSATILDGAIIGEGSIVGANSLVTAGKVFPPRSMIMGSPAKVVKELTQEDVDKLIAHAAHYVEYKNDYR